MKDIEEVILYWNENIPTCKILKNGEISIKKLLLSFSKDEIKKAIDIAIISYVFYEDEKINFESVEFAFSKLNGICVCLKDEVLQKALYIRGILRNRFYIKDDIYSTIVDVIKETYNDGYTLESIEKVAKNCSSIYHWCEIMEERENNE
jgi:hypothetical protein